MSNKLSNVVFIVAAGGKHGIGHLKRCVTIAESGEKYFNSYFNIIGDIDSGDAKNLVKYPLINKSDFRKIGNKVDLFVTDCRNTNKKLMKNLIKVAPIISVDDLGKGSNYALIRIISIPTLKNVYANYNGLQYLILNPLIDEVKREKESDKSIEKKGILISFGGSDPYNLTTEIVKILCKNGIKPRVIKGPLFKGTMNDLDVEIIENPKNIYKLISESEILVTSFGITMFESIYLKTPVILYNHSKYHYKLSLKFDLPNLAYPGYFNKSELEKVLIKSIRNKDRLLYSIERYRGFIDTKASERVVSIIRGIIDNGRRDCIFHHNNYKVIFRKESYSISRCLKCNDLFLTRTIESKNEYKKEYFLEEYKKQYGKNYEDDKENIINAGIKRLKKIEQLKPERGRLLDIGCALGFFVELASNRGWQSEGIEVSEYASSWARNTLGLNVVTNSFLNHDFKNEYYDAVTMFYVLEHFRNVEDVISKVYRILKYGGVLALALPNRSGISYRFNRNDFLANHPDDHFFDTNYKNITKFLSLNGFQVKDVRITGIHPERFFLKFGIKKSTGFMDRVYSLIANVLHLGDTFEVYAVKK